MGSGDSLHREFLVSNSPLVSHFMMFDQSYIIDDWVHVFC